MTSPDDDDPVRSELEYAPPWIREQALRDQQARDQESRDQGSRDQETAEGAASEQARPEQPSRDQIPREQITRDQLRAALRQSGAGPLEPPTQNELANRNFGDDRPWHQRALEPELVPEPPAGSSNLGPMMLRLGAVCAVAAMVAAAVVFLFSPKQPVHKVAQANVSTPATAGDDTAPTAIDPSRAVPALTIEGAAGASTQLPAPAQVAIATPSQEATVPPPQSQAIAVPEPQAAAPQIASLPAPNASPAETRPSRAPAMDQAPPRPAETNPPSPPAPAQTSPGQSSPSQAAPASTAKPAVVLDQNEISTLIKRGKTLLNDGDFAAARVLFERAANAGSAEAALALGSTYDPNVIKRLGAIMVKPDIESARKWYQLAADRGSAAASLQLANLPQSR